jgi:hydroxymethylpyrimidine/phosphomethylpyrimidine kinase
MNKEVRKPTAEELAGMSRKATKAEEANTSVAILAHLHQEKEIIELEPLTCKAFIGVALEENRNRSITIGLASQADICEALHQLLATNVKVMEPMMIIKLRVELDKLLTDAAMEGLMQLEDPMEMLHTLKMLEEMTEE